MKNKIEFIPFAKPSLSIEEEEAVIAVLRSGWLTTGEVTNNFEKEFASFTGAKHAMAVNSATAGLHLSLEALKIKPGAYVITSPYTFTASAEIIRYLNADPLFVDIEHDSFNINPDEIEKAIKKYGNKINAIIPVHLAGLGCKIEEIIEIADHYQIPVIEDAAHSFPVKTKSGFLGCFGTAGVFSFYANKTITTGEGGMIVTDNQEIASRIQIMRLHGIDRVSWDRYVSKNSNWFYQVVEAGFKYNMTDIASAIGRVQLRKAGLFLEQRKRIAERYFKGFSSSDFLKLPLNNPDHAWHLFIIRIKPDKLLINRDDFIIQLKECGIATSVHYIPLHIMPYYKNRYHLNENDFPVSLDNYLTAISLPIYPGLSDEQIDYIINCVNAIGKKNYHCT